MKNKTSHRVEERLHIHGEVRKLNHDLLTKLQTPSFTPCLNKNTIKLAEKAKNRNIVTLADDKSTTTFDFPNDLDLNGLKIYGDDPQIPIIDEEEQEILQQPPFLEASNTNVEEEDYELLPSNTKSQQEQLFDKKEIQAHILDALKKFAELAKQDGINQEGDLPPEVNEFIMKEITQSWISPESHDSFDIKSNFILEIEQNEISNNHSSSNLSAIHTETLKDQVDILSLQNNLTSIQNNLHSLQETFHSLKSQELPKENNANKISSRSSAKVEILQETLTKKSSSNSSIKEHKAIINQSSASQDMEQDSPEFKRSHDRISLNQFKKSESHTKYGESPSNSNFTPILNHRVETDNKISTSMSKKSNQTFDTKKSQDTPENSFTKGLFNSKLNESNISQYDQKNIDTVNSNSKIRSGANTNPNEISFEQDNFLNIEESSLKPHQNLKEFSSQKKNLFVDSPPHYQNESNSQNNNLILLENTSSAQKTLSHLAKTEAVSAKSIKNLASPTSKKSVLNFEDEQNYKLPNNINDHSIHTPAKQNSKLSLNVSRNSENDRSKDTLNSGKESVNTTKSKNSTSNQDKESDKKKPVNGKETVTKKEILDLINIIDQKLASEKKPNSSKIDESDLNIKSTNHNTSASKSFIEKAITSGTISSKINSFNNARISSTQSGPKQIKTQTIISPNSSSGGKSLKKSFK